MPNTGTQDGDGAKSGMPAPQLSPRVSACCSNIRVRIELAVRPSVLGVGVGVCGVGGVGGVGGVVDRQTVMTANGG